MGRRWAVVVVALVVGVAALVWPSLPEDAAEASLTAPPGTAAPSTADGPATADRPSTAGGPSATAPADTPHPAAPRAAGTPAPDLPAAVARAAEVGAGVDLGLAVVDLDTGAAAGSGADTPFRSASLSKLLVAVDLLTSGEVPSDDLDLLSRALRLSDDDAMNALWTLHDGMGAIDRVAARAGLTTTRAPADASQWGDVEMSAADVARLYRYVLTGLPSADREFVVTALSSASPTAADGFDQAYGLLAPGVDAYAKQGWMWYLPADLHLHSAGVVANRYAVAVLSVQTGVDEQDAKDRLTAITTALISGLTGPAG
ncbi:serine hydrolase [Saccharothrix sp. HUAS TT1]|uniref:serine hydrolase n=1 Tax=unclassified Saccharothrix TaxID=2593673 RepID=UPI00345C2FD1